MTKILLVITVLAMILLVGLSIYESYRSNQTVEGQTEDCEPQEQPQDETFYSL